MKYLSKLFLFIFLVPFISAAQSNFKPGYVVNLKGDTIKGLIDYREWNSNPNDITFKPKESEKVKKYTTDDIRYFAVTGLETYQKYTGPVTMDYTEASRISVGRDTGIRNVTVFLKVLQKGNHLTLYSFTDDIKTRFLIAETPDDAPTELIYRIYDNSGGQKVRNQQNTTVTENTFMSQLFALANKYGALNDDLQRQIERASYISDDLIQIVSKVNHLSNADLKRATTSGARAFNVFIGLGANVNKVSSDGSSGYSRGGGRSYSSVLPGVSAGIDFFGNPNTQQLKVRLEAGVTQNKFVSLYNHAVSPYIPFKSSFDGLIFNLTPQIIYNFYNTENFKIYGGAGMSFLFFNYSKSYLGSQSQPNSAAYIETAAPYLFYKSATTFVFKTGVQIHKSWEVFGEYTVASQVTEGTYYQMKLSSLRIGLNYIFK